MEQTKTKTNIPQELSIVARNIVLRLITEVNNSDSYEARCKQTAEEWWSEGDGDGVVGGGGGTAPPGSEERHCASERQSLSANRGWRVSRCRSRRWEDIPAHDSCQSTYDRLVVKNWDYSSVF